VGEEFGDPIGVEFKRVTDTVRLGQTLEDALWDSAKRLDTPEFRFFCISLSVQRETGGNLGETLENLADILRKRRQMQLKIRAMSAEAKTSAIVRDRCPSSCSACFTSSTGHTLRSLRRRAAWLWSAPDFKPCDGDLRRDASREVRK
jgi:tight adherence protein B